MSENSRWGKQRHTVSKIFSLVQSLFFLSNFMEIIRLLQSRGESGNPQFWGYRLIWDSGVCLYIVRCTKVLISWTIRRSVDYMNMSSF